MTQDDKYLLELIHSIEVRVEQLATRDSVQGLHASIAEISDRINRLEVRVMQRIDDAVKQEGQMKDEQAKEERAKMTRMVTIQTGILISAILALITAIISHLVGGFL